MGLPEPTLPSTRNVYLTIYGGAKLNIKPGSDVARPLRICVYLHKTEDWSPPIDLSLPCAEHDVRLVKENAITLLPEKVATFSAAVPYQDVFWITITGDFSNPGAEGRSVLKIKSPSVSDSCHWVNIDKNNIQEMSKSSGSNTACK